MSTSDLTPNPSVSVTVSRSIIVPSEIPVTQSNSVNTPSSQPPPPPPPSYRAIAPLHRHRPHQNLYSNPIPVGRSNSVACSPHQRQKDPSSLIYPFASLGRGFTTRPGRQNSNFVADPVGSPGGFPPRPVYAYHNGQFGSNMDPMIQFMRAAHPQIQQSPQFGSGHVKGVPHFLQPRVAHPPTSILDNGRHKNARSRDEALVLVRKRKVRITEGASLYSLCRSWLRNGAHEGCQTQQSDTRTYLPKPLPMDMMETSLSKDSVKEPNHEEDKEDEESVKELSESDLLKRHVDRAKKVRARSREERLKKIARYKTRLALLLPPFGEQCRNDRCDPKIQELIQRVEFGIEEYQSQLIQDGVEPFSEIPLKGRRLRLGKLVDADGTPSSVNISKSINLSQRKREANHSPSGVPRNDDTALPYKKQLHQTKEIFHQIKEIQHQNKVALSDIRNDLAKTNEHVAQLLAVFNSTSRN